MRVKLIVAKAANNVIGAKNDLIWHISEDLKFFKSQTTGHHMIMGRKTFESIGRPLPNRVTVIITRDKHYKQEGCIVVHSLEDALEACAGQDSVFITGGAQIYTEALNRDLVDELLITEVHKNFEGDAYFPELDASRYKELSRLKKKDEKSEISFSFVNLVRVNA